MIQSFRKFFQSTLGIVLTMGFLGVIALAFASMDVANTTMFGGVTAGDRVAVVGDRRIEAVDLSQAASNQLEQLRTQNPTITMESFAAQGGIDQLLDQMVSRWSIAAFAESIGLRAGSRLVDSEIVAIPAFRGASGEFDAEAFRAVLAQRGLNEESVRSDLAMGLLARQLIVPAAQGARLPMGLSQRYAQLLVESRAGRIAAIPAAAYAPTGAPSEAQLQAFYEENRQNYIRPERRVLRYASFGAAAIGQVAPPSDADIAARYRRDAATYQATERRRFTQLVVPTQAAANAVIAEVRGGMTLEASASAKGLAVVPVAETDRAGLAASTSAAVAEAGFAAAEGAVATAAQGALGWYVLRVDAIDRRAAVPLAQARAGIVAQLTEERRRQALNDATARIEDAFAEGQSLSDLAREYGVSVSQSPPLTAVGTVYGTNQSGPAELASVIPLAFEMDEGDPQIVETVPGESFVMFEVSNIAASAAAPLAEIREEVILAWRRDQGLRAAGEAAGRVLERMGAGQTLAAAMGAERRALPAVQELALGRRELAQFGQQVPATLMLMFSMAEGTAKRFAPPGSDRWFIVQLDEITAPDLAAGDQLVLATAQQLASTAGEEYVEQLVQAVEASLDIEINQEAVEAVVAQLTGQAG